MGTDPEPSLKSFTSRDLMAMAVAKRDELNVFIAILLELLKEAQASKSEPS
jgi:hypothetical protein